MYFLLTNVDRNYELYRAIAFPSRILNKTYASYKFNTEYLAISTLQKTYTLLSDRELRQCGGEKVKVCPGENAVRKHTDWMLCTEPIFPAPKRPRDLPQDLHRQAASPDVGTSEPQSAHFRCQETEGWTTVNLLHGIALGDSRTQLLLLHTNTKNIVFYCIFLYCISVVMLIWVVVTSLPL